MGSLSDVSISFPWIANTRIRFRNGMSTSKGLRITTLHHKTTLAVNSHSELSLSEFSLSLSEFSQYSVTSGIKKI